MRMPLPFASFLAVVLMVSPAAFAQTYEPGIDHPGGDYRSFDLSAPDATQCAATCMADAQCVAYTHVNRGVQGPNPRCWLKNVIPSPVASSCCTSGLKMAAAPIPMPVPAPTARVFPYRASRACASTVASIGPSNATSRRRPGSAKAKGCRWRSIGRGSTSPRPMS